MEKETQNSMGFWDINGSPNLGQTIRPYNKLKKEKEKNEYLPNCGLNYPGWPQSRIERKRKEGKVSGPCERIEKKCERSKWRLY